MIKISLQVKEELLIAALGMLTMAGECIKYSLSSVNEKGSTGPPPDARGTDSPTTEDAC